MPLPHPTALVRTACILCALDARIHGDAGAVVVKAFDHESPNSPWARDPQKPDPALTEGMPDALRSVIERDVVDLEGFERTWCAWWTGEKWIERGNDDFPVHLFARDADDTLEWLEEAGFTTDEQTLAAVLAGSRPFEDVVLTAAVPEEPDTTRLPEGFTVGDPFRVTLSPARPASGIALIKTIRGVTGAPLVGIKDALANAEPVCFCVLQRHSAHQIQRLGDLATLMHALDEVGGHHLSWVTDTGRVPLSTETFRGMLGEDACWLER